jgi:hypothetical protein
MQIPNLIIDVLAYTQSERLQLSAMTSILVFFNNNKITKVDTIQNNPLSHGVTLCDK